MFPAPGVYDAEITDGVRNGVGLTHASGTLTSPASDCVTDAELIATVAGVDRDLSRGRDRDAATTRA